MRFLSSSLPLRASLFAGSLVLAGCASTQLQEAPVADRSATATPAPAAADAPKSAVAAVTAAPAASALPGPANAGRVLYFDYDSAAIRPEFQPLLDQHARYLSTHRDRAIRVAGHTDERGGREYNIALGQERAEAVRRALRLLGVTDAQVEAVSLGEEKPAEAGSTEASWSRNRRAEISYR